MSRKLKILVSAYACEPNKGSEPGVGWSWGTKISEFAEVWVITRKNNRDAIEKELEKSDYPDLHFIYYDLPKPAVSAKRILSVNIYHYLWQIGVLFEAKKLMRKHHFDISHHLTFGTFASPSMISALPIPFVFGPIVAMDSVPDNLVNELGMRGKIRKNLRDIIYRILFLCDPLIKYTIKKSDVLISKTSNTVNFFKERFPDKYIIKMTANGIPRLPDLPSKNEIECRKNKKIFKVVVVGRMVSWKGFPIAIESFRKFQEKNNICQLDIVGDGPQMKQLAKQVTDGGIANKVVFHGSQPREKTLEIINDSDVLLFPSMLDAAASTMMEAMYYEKPVLCLDHGGPGDLITSDCGVKVRPGAIQEVIDDFVKALLTLSDSPSLCRDKGKAGKNRLIEKYSWENRIKMIKGVYSKAMKVYNTNK